MIFNRERGIVRATPKADLLAEEPNAYLRTEYDENNARVFFVCTGSRILASGISARQVYRRALALLKRERG